MAEQAEVALVAADRFADLVHLIDVAGEGPEVGIVWPVALPGFELVVVVIFNTLGRQVAVHDLEIGVGQARAASQQQEFELGVVADALDPDLVRALGGRNRDLACAAGPGVRMAAIVEVGTGRRGGALCFSLPAPGNQQQRRACGQI